jgi:hypothetical protein
MKLINLKIIPRHFCSDTVDYFRNISDASATIAYDGIITYSGMTLSVPQGAL